MNFIAYIGEHSLIYKEANGIKIQVSRDLITILFFVKKLSLNGKTLLPNFSKEKVCLKKFKR